MISIEYFRNIQLNIYTLLHTFGGVLYEKHSASIPNNYRILPVPRWWNGLGNSDIALQEGTVHPGNAVLDKKRCYLVP